MALMASGVAKSATGVARSHDAASNDSTSERRFMIIAQITDFHVRPQGKKAYGRVETNEMLARAVQAIEALPRKPDVVLGTGDLTDCGLPEPLSVMVSEAARDPAAVGVNVTLTVHEAFSASEAGQLLVCPKSPEFVPVIVMLDTLSVPGPLLVTVTG